MNSGELRVLLIEDEENDYIWLRDMLADIPSARFRVDWISTYEEAVSEICRLRHDVYLLDYRLGVRDGLELLREVMGKGCNVPIILLTGQGDHEVDMEAMKAGAADYLVKNQINADLIERSIRYSIKGKQMEEGLRREIAERKQIEAALRHDEARLEALLELSQMTEASIRKIADFAVEQQVKLTRSEIGWLGFINEDETILTVHAWSKAVMEQCTIMEQCLIENIPFHSSVEAGGIWADALRNRTVLILNDYSHFHPHKKGYPEGHIPLFRVMVVPVFDGNRIVMLAAAANKKEVYENSDVRQVTLLMDGMWKLVQRERAEKKLRESESLAAIGRALSGVAHDMKTPLIAIGGFTNLVQRDMDENDPKRARLEIVMKETRRLESMVKDMLDFSRPLELNQSVEDINRVVGECLELTRGLAEEKKVTIREVSSVNSVSFDPMRMKQALINLITNAVHASPEGEAVTISCISENGNLMVDVIDHGPGIPQEKRDAVLLPFFTTKKEGTGLGLAIVKKIVEAHQGHLLILDNPDRGLTFRMMMPNCVDLKHAA
jgi:signal transduction histidine kinase/DNA-binding response OmpR family regulator